MVFSLLLAGGAFAVVAWLMFNLSVFALPLLVGISAATVAQRGGAGFVGAALIGLACAAVAFALGRIAFEKASSPFWRAMLAIAFVVRRPLLAIVGRSASLPFSYQAKAGGWPSLWVARWSPRPSPTRVCQPSTPRQERARRRPRLVDGLGARPVIRRTRPLSQGWRGVAGVFAAAA